MRKLLFLISSALYFFIFTQIASAADFTCDVCINSTWDGTRCVQGQGAQGQTSKQTCDDTIHSSCDHTKGCLDKSGNTGTGGTVQVDNPNNDCSKDTSSGAFNNLPKSCPSILSESGRGTQCQFKPTDQSNPQGGCGQLFNNAVARCAFPNVKGGGGTYCVYINDTSGNKSPVQGPQAIITTCTVCHSPTYWTDNGCSNPDLELVDPNPVAIQCKFGETCTKGTGCRPPTPKPEPTPISFIFNSCPSEDDPNTPAWSSGNCEKVKTGLGITFGTSAPEIGKGLLGLLVTIGGAIAFIIIIITGYRLMTSQGDPEKIKAAREQLTSAIVGLLFIIFSISILSFLGVDVLGIFEK